MDCLRALFYGHFSSHIGDITWLALLLTTFLWEHLKAKEYANLIYLRSWKSTLYMKSETLIHVCCEQSWLISSHWLQECTACKWDHLGDAFFLKKVLAFYYWFSLIFVCLILNLVHHHSDLKIITFLFAHPV
jgi:hypothetical protein